ARRTRGPRGAAVVGPSLAVSTDRSVQRRSATRIVSRLSGPVARAVVPPSMPSPIPMPLDPGKPGSGRRPAACDPDTVVATPVPVAGNPCCALERNGRARLDQLSGWSDLDLDGRSRRRLIHGSHLDRGRAPVALEEHPAAVLVHPARLLPSRALL